MNAIIKLSKFVSLIILILTISFLTGCGGGGGGGSGAAPSNNQEDNPPGDSPTPTINSIRFGTPICSRDGAGEVDGRTFFSNTGTIDVEVTCEQVIGQNPYMRVWLQVNTSGAEIDHYDWQILNWENIEPHGRIGFYDEVVDIDLDEGRYIVRTFTENKVRYDSTNASAITDTFNEIVNVTVWTAGGKFANAFFVLNIKPQSGSSSDDHGNSAATATTILTNGTSLNGSIEMGNDLDFFKFSALQNKEYTISTGGNIDTFIALIDKDGATIIETDDDDGPGNLSLITWTALSSGTYYVSVKHFNSNGTGDYTLKVQESAGSPNPGSPTLVINNGFRPHLSPNASKIVFTRLSDSTSNAQSDIWVVNTDGTGLTRLTNTSNDSEFSPQWTPNGQSIAFVKKSGIYYSNTPGNLWEIQPNGSNLQQRWQFDTIKDFCFYVDSGLISIIAEENDGNLYLFHGWPNIEGSALRRQGGSSIRSQSNPSGSSPNIVLFDETLGVSTKVFVFNPVFPSTANYEIVNAGRFPWPFLSPSGTKIVAGADGGVPNSLYKMNLDGSNLIALTSDGRPDHQPTWSQNTIVFVRIPSGGSLEQGDLYKITGVQE